MLEKHYLSLPSPRDECSERQSLLSISMADNDFCQFGVFFEVHVNIHETHFILLFFQLKQVRGEI